MDTQTPTARPVGTRARTLAAPHALAVRTGRAASNLQMEERGLGRLRELGERFGYTVDQLLDAAAQDAAA